MTFRATTILLFLPACNVAVAGQPVVAPKPQRDVRRWVEQLGHRSSDIRQIATRNLVKAGARAVRPVVARVNDPDAEIAARSRRILYRLIYSQSVVNSDAARHAVLLLAETGSRRVRLWADEVRGQLRDSALRMLKQNGVAVSFDTDSSGREAARVDMSRWKGGDRSLVNLRFLGRIGWLDLSKARIDDDGLRWLREHSDISVLDLRETGIGDRGLRALAGMTGLKELDLRETKVTGGGLVFLARLARIESLHLGDTQLSSGGVRSLAKLKSLQVLNLSLSGLRDDDIAPLAGCKKLKRLWLSHTNIGDGGLSHLGKLKQLETLGLSGTKVTDAGLRHLHGLKNLETLWLSSTKVTDAGVKRLKAALPNVRVRR